MPDSTCRWPEGKPLNGGALRYVCRVSHATPGRSLMNDHIWHTVFLVLRRLWHPGI